MKDNNISKLVDNLNPEQRAAVEYTDGPLLILAGAGSGKTRVLTNKVAYLHQKYDVPLSGILAVTFTNKAAKEMLERVEGLLNTKFDHQNKWILTFHSLAYKILLRYPEKIGYKKGFVIYDYSDMTSLCKKILKDLDIDPKNFKPSSMLSGIGNAKSKLLTPDKYVSQTTNFYEETIAKVYVEYQKALKQNNAIDFDDLIFNLLKLFQEHPDVLDRYQKQFEFILIDEYQDINMPQYFIAHLLSAKHKRLFVVGDADQNIYSWRGANIQNILNFERDYPEAKVIKLEQNYRSTGNILKIANNIIKHNKNRKDKNLWTENQTGTLAACYLAYNEYDEAENTIKKIKALIDKGANPNEIAILYRTNAMSRVIEEVLLQYNIKYRIYGGLRFYERREIKDILAYLRLISNPADDLALARVINVPARKIGKLSVEKLFAAAVKAEKSVFDVIDQCSDLRCHPALMVFKQQVVEWQKVASKEDFNLANLIEQVYVESGYEKMLKAESIPENQSRIENIQELISASKESVYTLEEFLSLSALITQQDEGNDADACVTMMTLHSAKGLEYDYVFLCGFEENMLPHVQSVNDPAELEEERRLCYVGVTRARNEISISAASYRSSFGDQAMPNDISRFFHEIPKELMKITVSKKMNTFNHMIGPIKEKYDIKFTHAKKDPKRVYEAATDASSFDYTVGDLVDSPNFGPGKVVKTIGTGSNISLQIQFASETKLIMPKYGKLTKKMADG